MNIKKDDFVKVKRDISRWEEDDYAKAGQMGRIIDTFKSGTTKETWYAKVLIGDKVRTLRVTSIEKVQ